MKREIDKLFPSSVERCKIAYELMFWDSWLTCEELKKLGLSYERSESTVRDVANKLLGARSWIRRAVFPLYNYVIEEKELARSTGLGHGPRAQITDTDAPVESEEPPPDEDPTDETCENSDETETPSVETHENSDDTDPPGTGARAEST